MRYKTALVKKSAVGAMLAIFFTVQVLAGVLLPVRVSYAQGLGAEEGLPEVSQYPAPLPGIKPTNPFYFMDVFLEKVSLLLTFSPEKKAKKAFSYARERIAEAVAEASKKNSKGVEKALGKYIKNASVAVENAKEIKDPGQAYFLLASFSNEQAQHREVLLDILINVPGVMYETLQAAADARQATDDAADKKVDALQEKFGGLIFKGSSPKGTDTAPTPQLRGPTEEEVKDFVKKDADIISEIVHNLNLLKGEIRTAVIRVRKERKEGKGAGTKLHEEVWGRLEREFEDHFTKIDKILGTSIESGLRKIQAKKQELARAPLDAFSDKEMIAALVDEEKSLLSSVDYLGLWAYMGPGVGYGIWDTFSTFYALTGRDFDFSITDKRLHLIKDKLREKLDLIYATFITKSNSVSQPLTPPPGSQVEGEQPSIPDEVPWVPGIPEDWVPGDPMVGWDPNIYQPPATTTPPTTTTPPKASTPTLEPIPDLKLGQKGIISGTGFTPNGEVKVIFHRPDNTTSEHLGKADGYGNFDGTFTVASDRPPGEWLLHLIDLSTGQKIEIPFIVLP